MSISYTGHVGWGIAWYINGLLIPEIHVVRGKTYTFVIEGGQDPSQPAAYHPFYITDDPEGGYEFMTNERKRKVTGINLNTNWVSLFYQLMIQFDSKQLHVFLFRFKFSLESKTLERVVLSQLELDVYVNGRKIQQSQQVSRAHLELTNEHFHYSANKDSQESFNGRLMQARQI